MSHWVGTPCRVPWGVTVEQYQTLPKRSSLLRSRAVGRTVRAAIGAPTLEAGLVECTIGTKPRCSVCRGLDLKCAQGLAHGGMVPMVKGGTSGDGAGTGF